MFAHNVGGGALPAPPWLLSYIGAAFVFGTAAVLRSPDDAHPEAPAWTSAAFLGAVSWFFLAYHRPGSPRALATFLVTYSLVAIGAGLRWGRAWRPPGRASAACPPPWPASGCGAGPPCAPLEPWRWPPPARSPRLPCWC